MVEQIGRYRILNPLGKGAMGVVYLADDPLLNRKVAIKTVDLAVEEESEREFLCGRLLKDARAAAGLAHPGIVSVYDVLQESKMAYLVMEYISGESLAAVLKRTPRPDPAFALRVLREMASALDYTHARGVIHRDIKPANVMIDDAGAVKIMDFGIARIADSRTSTPTGMVMGTIQYMAPEQVKGETVDGRADQFALAAVGYEMLTGETLFGQHSLTTLAYKIVNEAPVPLRERNASIPPAVEAAIGKALSKAPQDRYATCGQFAAAMDRAFSGLPSPDDAPTVTLVRPALAPKSQSGFKAVAFALLAVAVLGGGVLVWHPWVKVPPPANSASASATPAAATPIPAPPPAPEPASAPVMPPTEAAAKKNAVQPPAGHAPAKPAVAESDSKAVPANDAAGGDDLDDSGPPPSRPALEAYTEAKQLNESGKAGAAIQSLDKAIAIRPRYAAAWFLRAQIRQNLKQWEAAAADYSESLKIAPRHALGYMGRGICLAQLGDDARALADFNKAIEINPGLFAPYNQRGLIFFRQKNYPKAIADYNTAIKLAPNAPFAYQLRANARRASGDAEGAREDLSRFRELKEGRGQ